MSDFKMPFTKHLEELRRRLITSAVAICVGFLLSYAFKEQIFAVLMKPWIAALPEGQEVKLIYTAPHEAFFTYLKVSFLAGIGVAIPVIVYQLWSFVAPGLYQNERRYLFPVVFFSSVFFVGGALFGYFFVFPFGFQFFTSFASDYIVPMVSTREFLSFSTRLLFAFGFIFELPIFTFFLARLGLINSQFLRRQRKFAVLLIFIVAAILTPPDVLTQLLMAGPLLVLYEISVWIAYFASKEKEEAKEGSDEKQVHSA